MSEETKGIPMVEGSVEASEPMEVTVKNQCAKCYKYMDIHVATAGVFFQEPVRNSQANSLECYPELRALSNIILQNQEGAIAWKYMKRTWQKPRTLRKIL